MPDRDKQYNIQPDEFSKNLPQWAQWVAQDPDGSWWAYEAEPHIHDNGWYENEVGRIFRLNHGEPNENWQSALIQISHRSNIEHPDC